MIAGTVLLVFAADAFLVIVRLGCSNIVMTNVIHNVLNVLISFATTFSIYIVMKRRRSSRFP